MGKVSHQRHERHQDSDEGDQNYKKRYRPGQNFPDDSDRVRFEPQAENKIGNNEDSGGQNSNWPELRPKPCRSDQQDSKEWKLDFKLLKRFTRERYGPDP